MWTRAIPLLGPWAALLFLVVVPYGVCAISRDELYSHGSGLDKQLAPDDDSSSEEIHLQVPIVFYGQEYTSLYVNTNGFLSFRTDIPSFINTEFPLEYPLIAPFYTNVDTRKSGVVFYRETQDAYVIAKATEDLHKYFHDHAFQPTSIFLATWADVGYHSMGSDKRNTFQVAIISNGNDSFVEFLYPDNGIEWIQGNPQVAGLPDARAQAGFISEDGRYLILKHSGTDHIRKISQMSNCGAGGIFVYHVGNVPDEMNVEGPEQYTVAEDIKTYPLSCSEGGSHQCHMRAHCVDHPNGFCCVCMVGYYGNGKTCLKNDVPLRVNGKISGELNGELLQNMDIQAYVIMSDGRSYTAISRVPDRFGYDLQTLNVIGGVIGWLFAKPIGDAKNGYELTGGIFNHTAEILFYDSGHKVTVRQQFIGLDVFDQLRIVAEIKGSIPTIPQGTKLEMSEYEEQYTLSTPGTVLSQSSRSFRNKGIYAEYPFKIEQSIVYNACSSSPTDSETKTYTLKVSKNFLGYESQEHIIRYGMSNKITPLGQEDPCIKGKETCVEQSSCVTEGDSYKCICNPGYHYIYPMDTTAMCMDINECSAGTHNCGFNAQCMNHEGSFSCQCNEGFEGDGITCRKISACERHRCNQNAECFDINGEAHCKCNKEFAGNGYKCWPLASAGCEVLHDCSPYASCIPTEYSNGYACQCLDGYVGDGYTCDPSYTETTTYYSEEESQNMTCTSSKCWCQYPYELIDGKCYNTEAYATTPSNEKESQELSCNVVNRCHPYAQCILIPSTGKYQCQCTAGYEGNGIECTEVEVSCEEVDICDMHAQCTYDPAISKSVCVCIAGYIGDGNICHLRDGCITSEDCEENAECQVNDEDSRRECVCMHGYVKDYNDACVADGNTCNGAKCVEYASCQWDPDYQINYCECDSGYQGNGIENCVLVEKGCNIINDCGLNAYCSSDSSGYKCVCSQGFYGNGYTCNSEQTCQYNPSMCSVQATCVERHHEYVCDCNPGYKGNGKVCEVAPKHEGNFLLLNQGMATLRVPFEPTNQNLGKPIHISYFQMAIGLDIDCPEGRVYWSDISGKTIMSTKYDGGDVQTFLSTDITSPEGLSIDWVSRNIYWTDSKKLTIEVANIETKTRRTIIKSDLKNPRGIAVHPGRGKVFWSDWYRENPKIEWANMDGTERKTFLIGDSVHLPNSLAIDWDSNELCYADAGTKSIECVQIDTLERHTVAINCTYPFGLAITETHYYWTDWNTRQIESLDKRTNQRQKGMDVPLGKGSGHKLFGIAAVPEECRPLSNVCQYENGKCQAGYLCLLDGRGGRNCACGTIPTGPQVCYD